MNYRLQLHADSICPPVSSITATPTLERSGSGANASLLLTVRYVIAGNLAELALAPPGLSRRADELWRHTCCEAFLGSDREPYGEFNFAPSTEWAVYRFERYREGMSVADAITPNVVVSRSADTLEVIAIVQVSNLSLFSSPNETVRIALSAVIEERSGRKSYWAIAHPPGKPDFHHPQSFVASEL